MRAGIAVFFSLLAVACSDPNAHSSAIVRQVEAAGAGDISSSQVPEIASWLVRHNDRRLIATVNSECAPLRRAAPVNWTFRTAEGRVCAAVASVYFPEVTADQRGW